MDRIVLEPEPKILDVGFGAEKLRCFEPVPEIQVPAPQRCCVQRFYIIRL